MVGTLVGVWVIVAAPVTAVPLVAPSPAVAAPVVAAPSSSEPPSGEPTATAGSTPTASITPAPTPSTPTGPVTAANYPWGCDFAPHGNRPSTPPLGPGPEAGRPVLGGDALAADGPVVPAGAPPLPDTIQARAWIVADMDTGEVLGAQEAHERHVPASITKVLLAATVLPKVPPERKVQATCEDYYGWGQDWDTTEVKLPVGGVYTVDDVFHALLLKSSNDAANLLARVAGGERGTAGTLDDMNALARKLGALDTHIVTPSGLDPWQLPDELDDGYQVTTAYDMALIFREAYRWQSFRRYIHTEDYLLPAQPELGVGARWITMRNSTFGGHSPGFIYTFPDALGGKTGYTFLAGHTFVGAFERDGRRIVAVVLGLQDPPTPIENRAYKQAGALIEWGYTVPAGSSVGHLVDQDEVQALLNPPTPTPPPSEVAAPPTGDPVWPDIPWLPVAGIGGSAVLLVAGVFLVARGRRSRSAAMLAAPQSPVEPDPGSPEQPPPAEPGQQEAG